MGKTAHADPVGACGGGSHPLNGRKGKAATEKKGKVLSNYIKTVD